MKRVLLLTTLLSVFYFANAQTTMPNTVPTPEPENKIRLGLQFCPTICFAKSDKPAIKNAGIRFGYNMGVIFDMKFADNYYFSTGINLVNTPIKINFVDTLRSSNTNPALANNDVDFKYKLQYLGLPITLKLKTKETNYMKYFAQFGIEPQFNTSKKVNANKGQYAGNDFLLPSETTYDNFNDDITALRINACIGGGVEYSLGGKTALVGGITYYNGFSDVSKQASSKITSSYIAINIGILF